jgi:hypothetical protein
MGKNYTYRWTHLPTKTTGTRTVRCMLRSEFLEKLNIWNSDGAGLWTYWEE